MSGFLRAFSGLLPSVSLTNLLPFLSGNLSFAKKTATENVTSLFKKNRHSLRFHSLTKITLIVSPNCQTEQMRNDLFGTYSVCPHRKMKNTSRMYSLACRKLH